ncbi:hypothetical protein LTR86_004679 [Recurvomyces mirabilis]|nr:hypothetical protein LTR86_004679 [Recurvomyces mirabilis]
MADARETAAETLALLEERLRRVDYILNGSNITRDNPAEEASEKTGTATQRLHHLERALAQLTQRSPAVAQVLALQKTHPAIFHPTSTSTSTPPLFPPTQLAALLLSHTDLYTKTSTSLTHLSSTTTKTQISIPDPAQVTKLITLRPRIERVMAKQAEQEREIDILRARSARAVQTWVEDGCLGMGDNWAEWEERLRGVEIAVRRKEGARRREEGAV